MRNVSAAALAAAAISYAAAALAADPQVERGQHLVTIAGCNDCHTPGYFLGKPDYSRTLAGSDVGFTIPGLSSAATSRQAKRQASAPGPTIRSSRPSRQAFGPTTHSLP